MTVDPRLTAATEIERQANALLRRADELVADSARMKRVARRLREESADLKEAESVAETPLRLHKTRKVAA